MSSDSDEHLPGVMMPQPITGRDPTAGGARVAEQPMKLREGVQDFSTEGKGHSESIPLKNVKGHSSHRLQSPPPPTTTSTSLSSTSARQAKPSRPRGRPRIHHPPALTEGPVVAGGSWNGRGGLSPAQCVAAGFNVESGGGAGGRGSGKTYICIDCGYRTPRRGRMFKHREKHHQGGVSGLPVGDVLSTSQGQKEPRACPTSTKSARKRERSKSTSPHLLRRPRVSILPDVPSSTSSSSSSSSTSSLSFSSPKSLPPLPSPVPPPLSPSLSSMANPLKRGPASKSGGRGHKRGSGLEGGNAAKKIRKKGGSHEGSGTTKRIHKKGGDSEGGGTKKSGSKKIRSKGKGIEGGSTKRVRTKGDSAEGGRKKKIPVEGGHSEDGNLKGDISNWNPTEESGTKFATGKSTLEVDGSKGSSSNWNPTEGGGTKDAGLDGGGIEVGGGNGSIVQLSSALQEPSTPSAIVGENPAASAAPSGCAKGGERHRGRKSQVLCGVAYLKGEGGRFQCVYCPFVSDHRRSTSRHVLKFHLGGEGSRSGAGKARGRASRRNRGFKAVAIGDPGKTPIAVVQPVETAAMAKLEVGDMVNLRSAVKTELLMSETEGGDTAGKVKEEEVLAMVEAEKDEVKQVGNAEQLVQQISLQLPPNTTQMPAAPTLSTMPRDGLNAKNHRPLESSVGTSKKPLRFSNRRSNRTSGAAAESGTEPEVGIETGESAQSSRPTARLLSLVLNGNAGSAEVVGAVARDGRQQQALDLSSSVVLPHKPNARIDAIVQGLQTRLSENGAGSALAALQALASSDGGHEITESAAGEASEASDVEGDDHRVEGGAADENEGKEHHAAEDDDVVSDEEKRGEGEDICNGSILRYRCLVCPFSHADVAAMMPHYISEHPTVRITTALVASTFDVTRGPLQQKHNHHYGTNSTNSTNEIRRKYAGRPRHGFAGSSSGSSWYGCDQCPYGHGNIHSVLVHYQRRHPAVKATYARILRRGQPPAKGAMRGSLRRRFGGGSKPDANAEAGSTGEAGLVEEAEQASEPTFRCRHCNYANRSVQGVLVHYQKRHPMVKVTARYVREGQRFPADGAPSADEPQSPARMGLAEMMRLLVTPLPPTPTVATALPAVPCGQPAVAPLPVSSSPDAAAEAQPSAAMAVTMITPGPFYCQECGYANRSVQGVLVHCQKRHPGVRASADIVRRHTALVRGGDAVEDGEVGPLVPTSLTVPTPPSHGTMTTSVEETAVDLSSTPSRGHHRPLRRCSHCGVACSTARQLDAHIARRHAGAGLDLQQLHPLQQQSMEVSPAILLRRERDRARRRATAAAAAAASTTAAVTTDSPANVIAADGGGDGAAAAVAGSASDATPSSSSYATSTAVTSTVASAPTQQQRQQHRQGQLIFTCALCPYLNARVHGVLTHYQKRHPTVRACSEEVWSRAEPASPLLLACLHRRRPVRGGGAGGSSGGRRPSWAKNHRSAGAAGGEEEGPLAELALGSGGGHGLGGYRCSLCPDLALPSMERLLLHEVRCRELRAATAEGGKLLTEVAANDGGSGGDCNEPEDSLQSKVVEMEEERPKDELDSGHGAAEKPGDGDAVPAVARADGNQTADNEDQTAQGNDREPAHRLTTEPSQKPYPHRHACTQCDFTAPFKSQLRRHQLRQHRLAEPPPPPPLPPPQAPIPRATPPRTLMRGPDGRFAPSSSPRQNPRLSWARHRHSNRQHHNRHTRSRWPSAKHSSRLVSQNPTDSGGGGEDKSSSSSSSSSSSAVESGDSHTPATDQPSSLCCPLCPYRTCGRSGMISHLATHRDLERRREGMVAGGGSGSSSSSGSSASGSSASGEVAAAAAVVVATEEEQETSSDPEDAPPILSAIEMDAPPVNRSAEEAPPLLTANGGVPIVMPAEEMVEVEELEEEQQEEEAEKEEDDDEMKEVEQEAEVEPKDNWKCLLCGMIAWKMKMEEHLREEHKVRQNLNLVMCLNDEQSESNTHSQSESRTRNQSESRIHGPSESRIHSQPEIRLHSQSESRPLSQSETRTHSQSESRTRSQSESRTHNQPESRTHNQSEVPNFGQTERFSHVPEIVQPEPFSRGQSDMADFERMPHGQQDIGSFVQAERFTRNQLQGYNFVQPDRFSHGQSERFSREQAEIVHSERFTHGQSERFPRSPPEIIQSDRFGHNQSDRFIRDPSDIVQPERFSRSQSEMNPFIQSGGSIFPGQSELSSRPVGPHSHVPPFSPYGVGMGSKGHTGPHIPPGASYHRIGGGTCDISQWDCLGPGDGQSFLPFYVQSAQPPGGHVIPSAGGNEDNELHIPNDCVDQLTKMYQIDQPGPPFQMAYADAVQSQLAMQGGSGGGGGSGQEVMALAQYVGGTFLGQSEAGGSRRAGQPGGPMGGHMTQM